MEIYAAKGLLLFLFALIFSVLINRIFLKFSKNLGIRNIDDKVIRWASTSKPAFGGISFFIVFLFSLSISQFLFPEIMEKFDSKFIGFISAAALAFLTGLADDAYNTNPTLKFLAQFLCGLILVFSGNVINLFDWEIANYIVTLFWVVGIMNSINMLDNMDAVATISSISVIACILIALILSYTMNSIYFLILVGLAGALLGFLFFNWSPSKMYMGDTGSQFLGVCLAALSIKFLWNFQVGELPAISRVLLVVLAFIVPLSDTTTVVINRISRGSSPFVGGKDHTTHHLSYLGLTEQSVALLLAGIGIVSASLSFILLVATQWIPLFTILFTVYSLVVFLSLYLVSTLKIGKKKQESHEKQLRKSA